MRAPDQINKQHPETDLMTQAIIRGAEGYRVAVPMMVAWDNLPRSVQVAICMEFADLRTPDAQPEPADRKALVGVIREAEGAWVNAGKDPNKSAAPFIADTLLARGLRLPEAGNPVSDPSSLATDIIAARLEWKQGGDDRNLTDATAAYLVSKGWTRGPDQAAVDVAERRGMEIMRERAAEEAFRNREDGRWTLSGKIRALPIQGGDDAA